MAVRAVAVTFSSRTPPRRGGPSEPRLLPGSQRQGPGTGGRGGGTGAGRRIAGVQECTRLTRNRVVNTRGTFHLPLGAAAVSPPPTAHTPPEDELIPEQTPGACLDDAASSSVLRRAGVTFSAECYRPNPRYPPFQ